MAKSEIWRALVLSLSGADREAIYQIFIVLHEADVSSRGTSPIETFDSYDVLLIIAYSKSTVEGLACHTMTNGSNPGAQCKVHLVSLNLTLRRE